MSPDVDTAGGADRSFDTLAAAYDRYRIGYADEVFAALGCAGIRTGTRVLDLACGTGLVSAELARRGSVVTGCDVSVPMLAHARARVPAATFERGAAEALPFAAGSFAGVVCAQAFHWFDQPRALAECVRVLVHGGTLAVWWKVLLRGDPLRLIRDEVARELGLEPTPDLLAGGFPAFDRAGLVDVRMHVIPWSVDTTVHDILGYEGSRARSRAAYADRRDAYLRRLAERLGAPDERYRLGYVHYLYLGRAA